MNPFVKLAFEAAGLTKLSNMLSDAAIAAGIGSLGMTGAAALQGQPLGQAALRGAAVGAALGGGPPAIEAVMQKSELLRPYSGVFGRFIPGLGVVPIIMATQPKPQGKH